MVAKKNRPNAGRADKKARPKTAPQESITPDDYRAALILDLQDSTTVWDQNATLALDAIATLDQLVPQHLEKFQGEIGNFTGDGFLLLFNSSENAIGFACKLIQDWEDHRRSFEEKFAQAMQAKIQNLLIIRTGIEFGRIYRLDQKVLGGAINRAQRCEAASKNHILSDSLRECREKGKSPPHFTIFITRNVHDSLEDKVDYFCSTELKVKFPGIQEETGIFGVWPKTEKTPRRERDYQKAQEQAIQVAEAVSKENLAERLLQEADRLLAHTKGQLDLTSRNLLESAINQYQEILQITGLPQSMQARAQNSLGIALCKLSERLEPEEKKQKLEAAEAAYRAALKVWTLDSAPWDYATTQNNLGNALSDQAALLAGEAREEKLNEAERTFQEALKVFTRKHYPHYHRIVTNNLERIFWLRKGG